VATPASADGAEFIPGAEAFSDGVRGGRDRRHFKPTGLGYVACFQGQRGGDRQQSPEIVSSERWQDRLEEIEVTAVEAQAEVEAVGHQRRPRRNAVVMRGEVGGNGVEYL
jgi:hypothetical protein